MSKLRIISSKSKRVIWVDTWIIQNIQNIQNFVSSLVSKSSCNLKSTQLLTKEFKKINAQSELNCSSRSYICYPEQN